MPDVPLTRGTASTPEAVVAAIAGRIGGLPARHENVGIDFGSGSRWLIDLSAQTVREHPPGGSSPSAEIRASPRVLARIVDGELDPRSARGFRATVGEGSVAVAHRWCDEIGGRRFPRRPVDDAEVPLPQPTTDRELARRQLLVHGYCILADVLDASRLARLRERLYDQAAAERDAGVATYDDGASIAVDQEPLPNQRLWALQNKGKVFLELLDHPVIDELVPDVLGDHFLVSSYDANIAGPGGTAMGLHHDHMGIQPPLGIVTGLNFVFCLDDFQADNGGTRVIPGSHIAERGLAPDDADDTERSVVAAAPAGSVIIWDTRLWHATGANVSPAHRAAILLVFVRSWLRTHQNGVLAVHPAILERMSDRLKTMFGRRVTGSLGKATSERNGELVGGDPADIVLEMGERR